MGGVGVKGGWKGKPTDILIGGRGGERAWDVWEK